MESSIAQSVHRGLENENWGPGRFGCETSDEVLWKLDALQTFITDLNWPEKIFATHLQHRLKVMANDMIHSMAKRILSKLEGNLKMIKGKLLKNLKSSLNNQITPVRYTKKQLSFLNY